MLSAPPWPSIVNVPLVPPMMSPSVWTKTPCPLDPAFPPRPDTETSPVPLLFTSPLTSTPLNTPVVAVAC